MGRGGSLLLIHSCISVRKRANSPLSFFFTARRAVLAFPIQRKLPDIPVARYAEYFIEERSARSVYTWLRLRAR